MSKVRASTPGATLITCEGGVTSCPLRFLIMDAPSPSSLSLYIKEMQKHNVSHLVRVCGPTYKSEIVEKVGIQVHHWQFEDGAPPPRHVVDEWLNLLDSLIKPTEVTLAGDTVPAKERVDSSRMAPDEDLSKTSLTASVCGQNPTSPTLAVHCVAGLGRAPILVALALVEYASFDPLDAIGYIRERRRGAINNVQLNWLMNYKRRNVSNRMISCCVVS